MLKQAQNSPIPVEEQVAVIYCGINGFLDDIPVEQVKEFTEKLRSYLRNSASTFVTTVRDEKKLSPEMEELLKTSVATVKAGM